MKVKVSNHHLYKMIYKVIVNKLVIMKTNKAKKMNSMMCNYHLEINKKIQKVMMNKYKLWNQNPNLLKKYQRKKRESNKRFKEK